MTLPGEGSHRKRGRAGKGSWQLWQEEQTESGMQELRLRRRAGRGAGGCPNREDRAEAQAAVRRERAGRSAWQPGGRPGPGRGRKRGSRTGRSTAPGSWRFGVMRPGERDAQTERVRPGRLPARPHVHRRLEVMPGPHPLALVLGCCVRGPRQVSFFQCGPGTPKG